jgi:AbiV family abortive infection protein
MVKKIYYGAFKCYENALELYEEGQILYDSGRLARSYTLFHFSFEELGRFYMMMKLVMDFLFEKIPAKEVNFNTLKKMGYTDHTKKLDKSVFQFIATSMYSASLGGRKDIIDQMEKLYVELILETSNYDANKNRSIYLNYEENEFVKPIDNISNETVEKMKQLSDIAIINAKMVVETFQREGDFEKFQTKIKTEIKANTIAQK